MTNSRVESNERVKQLFKKTSGFCEHVEQEACVRLQNSDLIRALIEATGKDLKSLALEDWDNDKVLKNVVGTEYIKKFPVILGSIDLGLSFLPDGIKQTLNEEQVKTKGEKWEIHKNDADPFPSDPHAHNYKWGLKLHLGSGELFNGTQHVGKMRCKKLKELRGKFKSITMPKLEC